MIVDLTVALVLGATAILSAPEPVVGRASWYDWRPGEAAAGPALRDALGPGWRGQTVEVCYSSISDQLGYAACAYVRLTDWCQCYKGTTTERIIDLDRRTFGLFASPSRGLVRVVVHLPASSP